MRYRHARADYQVPVGNIGKSKIGGLLDVRVLVDPKGYRGKHRVCTCPAGKIETDRQRNAGLGFIKTVGCPSHSEPTDVGGTE